MPSTNPQGQDAPRPTGASSRPAENLGAFARAHPAPDHQAAMRLRRIGNGLIGLAVVASALAVLVWVVVPFGSLLDRLVTAVLPLLALMAMLLRRVYGGAIGWVENHPDPYGLEDEELRDFFGVNRFDTALSWLTIPGLTLLARSAIWYRAADTGLAWLLDLGVWLAPVVLLIPSGFAGYWTGTRHRRRWLFRLVSLGWASLVLLGAVWGVNIVFTTDPGTAYTTTVARDFHSSYDDRTGFAPMQPPIYLRPFAAAPRGLTIVDPILGRHRVRAGSRMRIDISRGALGLPWLRSYGLSSSSPSGEPIENGEHPGAPRGR